MNEKGWVTFMRRRHPMPTDKPFISIDRHRVIRINWPAWEAIGRPRQITFMVDTERRAIAIKHPDPSGEARQYAVRTAETHKAVIISAQAVLKYMQITDDDLPIHRAVHIEDGMIVIDLKDTDEGAAVEGKG